MNKKKEKKNDCTILVLSCDKYSDLWVPFFGQFWKYWPDCPYPVVLGSNTIGYKDPRVKTILSGPDRDWSSSLRAILEKISTPYIFLWLDDIFPIERIRTKDFSDALAFMIRNKGKHMHMGPSPSPDDILPDGKYGIYEKGAPYRATALGFWDISYLHDFLLPGENPWNFEIMGSYRTSYAEGFYCSMKPLFELLHVVEKGKIFQDAYEYCLAHSIALNTKKREVLSQESKLKSRIQIVIFNTVIKIPWRIRVAIMDVLRKLLISY